MTGRWVDADGGRGASGWPLRSRRAERAGRRPAPSWSALLAAPRRRLRPDQGAAAGRRRARLRRPASGRAGGADAASCAALAALGGPDGAAVGRLGGRWSWEQGPRPRLSRRAADATATAPTTPDRRSSRVSMGAGPWAVMHSFRQDSTVKRRSSAGHGPADPGVRPPLPGARSPGSWCSSSSTRCSWWRPRCSSR